MVQVRLCLGQWHPVRGNGSDNLATRASNPLGIRELVAKPSTQCSKDIPLFLRGICLFAQTSLTLRKLNALKQSDSTEIIYRSLTGLSLARPEQTLPSLRQTISKLHLCLLLRYTQPL